MVASMALPATALAAPSNDNFANAITYSPDPMFNHYALFDNVGATKELLEPNHAGNAGGSSVWFNITYPVSGPTEVGTCVHTFGEFDTLVAVYTGNAVNALTAVASNDNAGDPICGLLSKASFSVVAGTTYHVAVDGAGGAQGNFGLIAPRVLVPNVSTVSIDKIDVNKKKKTATVSFTATDSDPELAGNNINECQVDNGDSLINTFDKGCVSPAVFKNLKPGGHTVKIRRGDTLATQRFTLKKKKKKKKHKHGRGHK